MKFIKTFLKKKTKGVQNIETFRKKKKKTVNILVNDIEILLKEVFVQGFDYFGNTKSYLNSKKLFFFRQA